MRPSLVSIALAALAAVACRDTRAPDPPPSVPASASGSATASASAPVRPAAVRVVAVSAPGSVRVDGDLSDWGDAMDAAPRLAVALTSDALYLAARLDLSAADGVWLGVGAWAPKLPPVGVIGIMDQLEPLTDCASHPVVGQVVDEGSRVLDTKDVPNAPAARAACKVALDRYTALRGEHERRFEKRFKLDREGIRELAQDGALVPIAHAEAAWRVESSEARVEIALPLSAMPRLAQAPLPSLKVFARTASDGGEEEPWTWVHLPAPVTFQPHGAERDHALEVQRPFWEGTLPDGLFYSRQSPALSYQPGDPLHLERMAYVGKPAPFMEVAPREELLYQQAATLGDVQIGFNVPAPAWPAQEDFMPTAQQWLSIFRGGAFVALVDLKGNVRRVVNREGELHVVSSSPYNRTNANGPREPVWSVVAVAADGSHRELTDECPDDGDTNHSCGATTFASAELDRFGWRTKCQPGAEVTFTWDTSKKRYTCKQRLFPGPGASRQ